MKAEALEERRDGDNGDADPQATVDDRLSRRFNDPLSGAWHTVPYQPLPGIPGIPGTYLVRTLRTLQSTSVLLYSLSYQCILWLRVSPGFSLSMFGQS